LSWHAFAIVITPIWVQAFAAGNHKAVTPSYASAVVEGIDRYGLAGDAPANLRTEIEGQTGHILRADEGLHRRIAHGIGTSESSERPVVMASARITRSMRSPSTEPGQMALQRTP